MATSSDLIADSIAEISPLLNDVADYFALLSEPNRLKVLHVICQEEKSVTEVVEHTALTQSNVSRMLGMLHDAGVVSRRKDGLRVLYRVCDDTLVDICRTACVGLVARAESSRKAMKGGVKHFMKAA